MKKVLLMMYVLVATILLASQLTTVYANDVLDNVGRIELGQSGNFPNLVPEEDRATMTQKYKDIFIEMTNDGFDMGTPRPGREWVIEWDGIILQEFTAPSSRGVNPWAPGDPTKALLVYNLELKEVYLVKDEIYSAYSYNNATVANKDTAGAPRANDFEYSGFLYQNFDNGYYKFELADPSNGSFVASKQFDQNTGTEYELTGIPNNVGRIDSSLITFPIGFTGAQITNAFIEAYIAYDTNQGWDLGIPASNVKSWNGFIVQDYSVAFSTANPWGDGRSAVLVFDESTGYVFLIKDEFFTIYSDDLSLIGYPTSEEMTFGDFVYQNFSKGYLYKPVVDADVTNTLFVAGKLINTTTGLEEDMSGDIGLISPIVESFLPDTITKEQVQSKFIETYDELVLTRPDLSVVQSVLLRAPYAGYEYVHQKFTSETTNETLVIFLSLHAETLETFVLSGDMLRAYETMEGTSYNDPLFGENGYNLLGSPVSNEMVYQGAPVQQFQFGYILLDENTGAIDELMFGYILDIETGEQSIINGKDLIKLNENFSFPTNYMIDGVVMDENDYINAFKDKYQALLDEGINPGIPFHTGIAVWTPGLTEGELINGLVHLKFNLGGSIGYVYVSNSMMTYNPENGEVHVVDGHIWSSFSTIYHKAGYAIEASFVEDGYVYQNFKNGYIKVNENGEGYRFFEGRFYDPSDFSCDTDQTLVDGECVDNTPEPTDNNTNIIYFIAGGAVIVLAGVGFLVKRFLL